MSLCFVTSSNLNSKKLKLLHSKIKDQVQSFRVTKFLQIASKRFYKKLLFYKMGKISLFQNAPVSLLQNSLDFLQDVVAVTKCGNHYKARNNTSSATTNVCYEMFLSAYILRASLRGLRLKRIF